MDLANNPIVQAVADHVRAHLPAESKADVTTDPSSYRSNLIIVEPIVSPTPESVTWNGTHDRAECVIQVTAVCTGYEQARLTGDVIRNVLAGKTGRHYTHPLAIPNVHVDTVTSNNDGYADTDGSTSQWAERYTITFQ